MVIYHQKMELFFAFLVVYRTNQHTAGVNAHHRSRRKIGNSDTGLTDQFLRLVIGVNTA